MRREWPSWPNTKPHYQWTADEKAAWRAEVERRQDIERAEYEAQMLAEHGPRFIGKTIDSVRIHGTSDRINAVTLYFTDGESVRVEWWASYADDGGLEIEANPSSRKDSDG